MKNQDCKIFRANFSEGVEWTSKCNKPISKLFPSPLQMNGEFCSLIMVLDSDISPYTVASYSHLDSGIEFAVWEGYMKIVSPLEQLAFAGVDHER